MRSLYYDVTHLRHNAPRGSISGVIRIDFEIARHLFSAREDVHAIQYGVLGPSLVKDVNAIRASIDLAIHQHRFGASNPCALQAVVDWLKGAAFKRQGATIRKPSAARSYLRFLTPPYWMRGQTIEPGAVYLNAAQHALAYPSFLAWLGARRDVRSIFLLHDLLPLDYPEFWRDGHRIGFERAISVLARIGSGFIVTSEAVRQRLDAELVGLGRVDVPILRTAPPAFLRDSGEPSPAGSELSAIPYFVVIGMIEPRKNHLLILNIWRSLVERGEVVPKLIIVGKRGWENEQVLDMLERSRALQGHVLEVSDLADLDAATLIRNARALLFPSFAEGFGLSVAEALSLGTPVLASDIPVLRETSSGKATFISPLDGPGWTAAILALADRDTAAAAAARRLTSEFIPRPAASFLSDIEDFITRI